MKLVLAIPHSHTWLWTQTCLAALQRFPPRVPGVETQIVVVDNAWDWSPAIMGVTETRLGQGVEVLNNPRPYKFHASGLDAVLEAFPCDYFMAWETDVLPLRAGWLQWFVDQLRPTDYAVGHWHHEQFINPSCTLYRASVLRDMLGWCRANTSDVARWGDDFEKEHKLPADHAVSVNGPLAELRGWPRGTKLKERPTGQSKGPSWYEPGQALYHWATDAGWEYTACETTTQIHPARNIPVGTHYGDHALHLWAGTRALDLLKHPVEDPAVRDNMGFWLEREAHYWLETVPKDVQEETLGLIGLHGWYSRVMDERETAAVDVIEGHYRRAGVAL